jgi:hypothetical protein
MTPVADEITELLVSGLVGLRLVAALHERFGSTARVEVYFGVAMAVSQFELDRIGLMNDLIAAEAKLAAVVAERCDE